MHPYVAGLPTYSFFYGGAAIVQFAVCLALARRMELSRWWSLALAGCYCLGMFVGAKALYDVGQHAFHFANLVSPASYEKGGLWGGPLVVLAAAVPIALATKKSARLCDLLALSLPPALALAHAGCFFAGCCYGRPTTMPWAVTFPAGSKPPNGVPLHPTQLYEIALLALTLAALVAARRKWPGLLLAWFLALYGAGRAVIELFRGDERLSWAGISLSQAICAAVAAAAALVLAISAVRRRSRRSCRSSSAA